LEEDFVIRRLLLAGLAASALVATVHAQPANSTRDFIIKAAQTDAFERREGRLAEQRAVDHDVRAFAREMVSVHTQTTYALQAAIRRAGMPVPPAPPLSDDQQRMIQNLSGRRGRDFDRTYIDQQVQAHQQALGVVSGYANNGRPGPIRDAARKTVPIVQHHLDMASALQHRLGSM
jgi:putative membrane protein